MGSLFPPHRYRVLFHTNSFMKKKCCSVLAVFEEGIQVHKHAVTSGLGKNLFVRMSLLNFYTKCVEVDMGRRVFHEMTEKNMVAWNAMVGGYSGIGKVNEALGLFREMQKGGVMPDEVTMICVLSVCALTGALDLGKWLHIFIDKNEKNNDLEVSTALLNMYAKCGCIEKVKHVFDVMLVKDAKVWSSMVIEFAINGLVSEAMEIFEKMQEAKVEPNHVTFVGVLSACAHDGLVAGMPKSGIEPSLEHYGCMIDLFCRANQIEEAYESVLGSWAHLEATEIQKVLKEVAYRVQATLQEPWIATVLRNIGDGEKREALWEHNELLWLILIRPIF